MSEVEAEFRRVEAILDKEMRGCADSLRTAGVEVSDDSARTYHYKNQHLFWSQRCSREWLVNVERARATVHMFYGEPVEVDGSPPTVKLMWRAEVFRRGSQSHIDLRHEKIVPLTEIQNEGIEQAICSALEEASGHLPAPL